MDIYEIQREVLATGIVGLENMPVHMDGEAGLVTKAEVKYDNDGFPYILLGCE